MAAAGAAGVAAAAGAAEGPLSCSRATRAASLRGWSVMLEATRASKKGMASFAPIETRPLTAAMQTSSLRRKPVAGIMFRNAATTP
ncbi:hypothetical protein D3C72_1939540 [compost metagenome]